MNEQAEYAIAEATVLGMERMLTALQRGGAAISLEVLVRVATPLMAEARADMSRIVRTASNDFTARVEAQRHSLSLLAQ